MVASIWLTDVNLYVSKIYFFNKIQNKNNGRT